MDNIVCEICGSNDVNILNTEAFVKVKHGTKEFFSYIIYICNECGSEIQTSESCEYQESAIKRSKENSVFNMLNQIEKLYGFSTFERVLDIPFGTFDEWKNNNIKPSDAEIALLKIILENPERIVHIVEEI